MKEFFQRFGLLRSRSRGAEQATSVRSLGLRLDAGGRPASLDEQARSVEVVAATETDEVPIYDYDLGRVPEILLMSGMRMPKAGRIPLLDTHNRYTTEAVLGSARDLRIEGDRLLTAVHFSATDEGERAFRKVQEGHLTDFSASYRVFAYRKLAENETAEINGRTWSGPKLLAVDWEPKELSICPIGADPDAKARAEAQPTEDEDMKKFFERLRKKLGLPEEASMRQIVEALGQRGFGSEQALEAAARSETDQEAFLEQVGKARSDAGRQGQAQQPQAGQSGQAAPSAQDLDGVRAEAARAERERCQEIRAMCERHGCPELADKLIGDGRSLDQARAAVLEHLEAKRSADSGGGRSPGFHVAAGPTDEEKFRSAASDALLLRGGVRVATPAPGAEELRCLTLRELARECLVRAGQRVPSNPLEMVGRSFTSSDLPNLLTDSSRRALAQGYEESAEDWREWCGTGSLSDFKPTSLVRLGAFGDLDEIPEGGEYEAGRIEEEAEKVQIAKFGKRFLITREAVINDDLGALTEIPANMGRAAARTVAHLPYAVLTANSAMADNVALFHVSHGNIGTAGPIAVATLAEAERMMALQKTPGGNEIGLNIAPQFILAPVAQKAANETFFATTDLVSIAADNKQKIEKNIYAGKYTRIYNPRLDADSPAAWYMAGRKGSFINVYFLFGNQTPWLETRNGWSVDGVEHKVRIEAAAKALDYRTGFLNAGE